MKEFKAIPGTLGLYGINKAGEVKKFGRNRIIPPYRNNTVRIAIDKKRININIVKTVALVFSPGYVDDAPDTMQNIVDELNTLKDRIIILVRKIERDREIKKIE